jgi:hypothetical protein
MMLDFVKEATRDLFDWHGEDRYFDARWQEGWRPVLDDGDILFSSKLGSYTRRRRSEFGHRFAFQYLTEALPTE